MLPYGKRMKKSAKGQRQSENFCSAIKSRTEIKNQEWKLAGQPQENTATHQKPPNHPSSSATTTPRSPPTVWGWPAGLAICLLRRT